LQVTDDGVGMPPHPARRSGTGNIARRAELLNGTATWTIAPTGGTVLQWRVPRTHQPPNPPTHPEAPE